MSIGYVMLLVTYFSSGQIDNFTPASDTPVYTSLVECNQDKERMQLQRPADENQKYECEELQSSPKF